MKKCKQDKIMLAAIGVLAVVQILLFIIPVLWVIEQSFNNYHAYIIDPFSFPKKFRFENYSAALKNMKIDVYKNGRLVRYNIVSMTGYSLLIALFRPFLTTAVSVMLSYVVEKYSNWRICRIIYALNLITIILPIYGGLPSGLRLHKALGTYDSLTYLLVGYTGMGMGIILYGNAFGAMPTAYKEAATIDGAGHFMIMFKIYFPLIFPLAAANYIMNFMGFWNDYSLNVVWLPSYPNLAYGVFIYQSNASIMGASVPELLAGMVALAIPSTILWACSQKLVSSKLAMGGLKG